MSNLIENRQIRVFISSTFQDMQDERDYLMKRTFPKLRKLAAERDVTLTELDLRWGITEEESKSGKVVEICLREIENSIPFFIGIIGNRYGWVPKKNDIGENVTDRFKDVNGYIERHLSVTEMEMQFGVLQRKEDMHAYFYIKEGEEKENADNPEMLERLKSEVKDSKYPSSTYSSPEDLALQVEKAFTALLNQLFPEGSLTEHDRDRLIQNSFIRTLSSTYIRDENAFKILDNFVSNTTLQHLVVTGESGLGKSALLANWAKSRSDNEIYSIITYFSSNGGNQTHSHIQKYLIEELIERYNTKKEEGTEEVQLQKMFNQFALRDDKLVVVLDAVNQIADINQAKMLNWLPIPPKNIKFIFSTLEDDITMEVFRNRGYEFYALNVLTEKQRISLIEDYLKSYGKKLKPEQVKSIANFELCKNTLVLRTLLDELVCFGEYERLDDRIKYYMHGETNAEFYDNVITRFENDFGEKLIRNILGLIAVSRNGLTEEELIEMTGTKKIEWSDFFCGFSTHLNNQSGRLVFTHTNITKTVWTKYLKNDKEFEEYCRRTIINHFKNDNSIASMQEIPYNYDLLNDWDSLHDYILIPSYLIYCMDFNEVEIGTYWRHYFEAKNIRTVSEYISSIESTPDKVLYLSKILRLCKVLCLEEDKKKFGHILYELVKAQPELESPAVYRTLADSLRGDVFIPFALKSIELCKQDDVEEQQLSYGILSGAYYEKAVFQNDQEAWNSYADIQKKRLEFGIKYYGELHPFVQEAYRDLSLGCDDPNQGLIYAQKAIDLGIALYGKDHPLLGRPYHYKGCIYRELQEWDKAYEFFKKAYDVWLPAYGLYHEIMVSSCGNQGKALLNLKRYDKALECYDTCIKILSIIYEEKGYDYAICMLNKSKVLRLMHKTKDALDLCKEAEMVLHNDKTGQSRVLDALITVQDYRKQLEKSNR